MDAKGSGWRTGPVTAATKHDRKITKDRCAAFAQTGLYGKMYAALKQFTKRQLLPQARGRAAQLNVDGPDRTAKRYREALIYWFCQHWPELAGPTPSDLSMPQDGDVSGDVFDEFLDE
jgi:hypothetical protein